MTKRMSVRDARANFSDLIGAVLYTKEPVIIERKGRPAAVVISTEQFERYQDQVNGDTAVIPPLPAPRKRKRQRLAVASANFQDALTVVARTAGALRSDIPFPGIDAERAAAEEAMAEDAAALGD